MDKKKRENVWKCVKEGLAERVSTYDLVKLIIISCVLFCGVFILDYLDIPSRIIQDTSPVIMITILATFCVICIALLVDLHIFDLLRIASVNSIDAIVFSVCLVSLLYTPVRMLTLGYGLYTGIASLVSVICIVVGILRFIFHCKKLCRANNRMSNLIDLKDLLEGTFTRIPDNPILVSERDVDYDLLERDGVTNQLFRSIIHCHPHQSYVISLEGEWGIGKTTIINNTKRLLRENTEVNREYIYIDDFDPWLYGTQEALLLAMLETLIHHSGMHYSPSKFSSIVQGLRETVSNSHSAANFFSNLIFDARKSGDSVAKLKQRIIHYLRTTNKTIVFFIDNLDRASDENVMFLFKLIGVVFDLPGIIYVLSFEKDRINAILAKTSHFDPRFTEKIIQQEIKVPAISEEKSKYLYSACITNLLDAYGVSLTEMQDFIPAARYIIGKTHNIREFKRMINSVFSTVFCNDTLLKKSELLAIEAIHFFDPDLFYSIYKNPKFFISHDKNPILALRQGLNKKDFNAEGVDFFKTLFSTREDTIELLSALFPYVKRFKNKVDLESDNSYSDPDSAEITKQSRICSGKYFDLYFSYSSNRYIKIRESIEDMIKSINNCKGVSVEDSLVEVSKRVTKYLSALKKDEHKEWVERLQLHITDIDKNHFFDVAGSLFALIYYIDDDSEMFRLDARTRTEYIISMLLEKCSEKEFDRFLELTKEDYKQLRVLYSVQQWMNSEKIEHAESWKARAERFTNHYNEMCIRIVKEDINLFDDKNYSPKNAWGLYYYYKTIGEIEGFTLYVGRKLSADNIYRVIWDVTTASISDHYSYSISNDNYNVFFSDSELVERIISKRPPKSKDEEFVLSVYEMYKHGEVDIWGNKGMVSPVAKKLTL